MRLKLTIAYDGYPFQGWQTQPQPELTTVQGEIHKALEIIAKEPVKIHGSGRTDTGVHATGQTAHFNAPASVDMNAYNWVPALNSNLPHSIRIMDCEEVTDDFHARHSAVAKTYAYRLCLAPVLPPHDAHRAWHLPRLLDPLTLDQAMALFLGTHNFRNFCALRGNEYEGTEYERTIIEAKAETTSDGYLLTFSGYGFLYKMVRFMASAAVNASQGRLRLDDLNELLKTPHIHSHLKVPCAPPDGLTLVRVDYE